MKFMAKAIISLLIVLLLSSCVGGNFVGTNFVPVKAFNGKKINESEVVSVAFGRIQDYENLVVSLFPVSVNDIQVQRTNLIIQCPPGFSNFEVTLVTKQEVTSNGVGWTVATRETKPFKVTNKDAFKPGYIYGTKAKRGDDGKPTVEFIELGRSSNHIFDLKKWVLNIPA